MSHFPAAAMQRLLAPAVIPGPVEAVRNITAAAEARQAGAVRPGVASFKIGDHVAVAGDNLAGVAIGHTGQIVASWLVGESKTWWFVVDIDGWSAYDLPSFMASELMHLEPFETARAA